MRGRRAGGAAEGVEPGEEPARSEGLSAESRSDFPNFGTIGQVGSGGGVGVVGKFGDVLEGFDEFVDAVAFGEEDD